MPLIFLFFAHIPFVVNHTINATPPERLQQYHDKTLYPTELRSVLNAKTGYIMVKFPIKKWNLSVEDNASFLCWINNAPDELSWAVVTATVEGKTLPTLLYTGSSYNFIHVKIAQQLNLKANPQMNRLLWHSITLTPCFFENRCYAGVPLLVI